MIAERVPPKAPAPPAPTNAGSNATPNAGRAPSRRRPEEMEFLPAALEVLERPPSPTARLFTGAIIAFAMLAAAWSWFGELDMAAVAQGRIIPSGHSKTVQPMEIGVVRAIHVQDGQTVAAGDVLIELDPTSTMAERDRLAADLADTRTEAARLTAILAETADPLSAFVPPAGAPPATVHLHRQLLASQMAEQRAKLAALRRELARREADRATVLQTIAKLDATIPLVRERSDALGSLAATGNFSKLQYLQVKETLVGEEQDRLVQKTRLVEVAEAIAGLQEQGLQTEAEFRRTRFTELAQAEQKAAGLAQELAKAEQRLGLQRLTAPVGGTVQQLAVHTLGGVVTPAQPVLVIVPEDSRLEVEAQVLNQDIGFIAAGQRAEVKVQTFTFTKYGLLPGHVVSVSRDAVPRDKDSADQGPLYTARIALERTSLTVDGREATLAPGMAVTAEIKTGTRRILDYLLSPLARTAHDAFTER